MVLLSSFYPEPVSDNLKREAGKRRNGKGLRHYRTRAARLLVRGSSSLSPLAGFVPWAHRIRRTPKHENVASTPPAAENNAVLRRLFNLATAPSLVLLVATVAMWVRSYWACESVEIDRKTWSIQIGSYRDRIGGFAELNVFGDLNFYVTSWLKYQRWLPPEEPASQSIWQQIDFFSEFRHLSIDGPEPASGPWCMTIRVPYWIIALVLSMPPFYTVRSRWKKHASNCCTACGYNLTANVSGVCPECGSKVPA